MTREEFQALVEVVLGMHTSPDRVDTIMRAADAYAATIAQRQRELLEGTS